MSARVGPAEAIRLRPGVAFVPGVGHHAPPARHSSRCSFNSSTSWSRGSWMQVAPPGRVRGRGDVDSLPVKLRTGYAPLAPPPGPPALQCSRPNRSLPSFRRLPCVVSRPRDPPRMPYGCASPPARWAHAHATPRGCAGAGLLERWRSWVIEVFLPFPYRSRQTCARRFLKTKIAPPMSLPSCAMRCIVGSPPAATASSEPG
jgi:hypothetical protein